MKVLHRYKLTIILACILLVAAFLRLYRIADYLTFLGDEGRDALVVKGILEGNLVFLGPRASSGDFFLGPIYYYMMAPFLWLFGLNPVGPAIMIAILGVITVYLVYKMTKEFFGTEAGLIASLLYGTSALVVQFSKSSWNPNAVPFFSLLMMYALYHAVKKQSLKLYLVVGVAFGILMQLHYIVIFLGIAAGLFVLIGPWVQGSAMDIREKLLGQGKGIIVAVCGFIIGFAPFLAFEIKNGFPNFRTIFTFIGANTVGGKTSSGPVSWIVSDVFVRVFGRLLIAFPSDQLQKTMSMTEIHAWVLATIAIAACCFYALFRIKDTLLKLLFSLWIVLGIVLFAFYRKPIYDYYFVFLFPVPFMLLSSFLSTLYLGKTFSFLRKIAVLGIILCLVIINIRASHLWTEPNRQMLQMERISEFVLTKADSGPYNFALITDGNSDHAYRFFFSMYGRDPKIIENEVNDPKRTTVANQLLVICEEYPCRPLGHPLFEVAAFGRAEIVQEWELSIDRGRLYETPKGEKPFVTIVKLKHYQEDK